MYNLDYNLWLENLTLDYCSLTQRVCYACGEEPRKKMYKYKELFDLRNLPVSSKYYCSDNKKVVGKMKEEYGGKLLLKFVSLKSKMY